MFGLMRRNRHPTPLRHLVSLLHREAPTLPVGPLATPQPSHHIFSAGTYTPVFARLAAETALKACPAEWRRDFRLYIHVDGVASSVRPDLLAWLREIPGVEVTYGLFGILPVDRIPGKWHQVMINDVVRRFRQEKHLAFIDADLFVQDDRWWQQCRQHLGDDVYALTAGLRPKSTLVLGEQPCVAMKTNLFTLNTQVHLELNEQRFNKDQRALDNLRREFPKARIEVNAVDTQICASLRAQAHGYKVLDVEVPHCHIGGFSHLKAGKFKDYQNPERQTSIRGLLGQARFLPKVIAYFDRRGWGRFVEAGYRQDIGQMLAYIDSITPLRETMQTLPLTPREAMFDTIVNSL